MTQLILIRGIPGSGKSTLASALVQGFKARLFDRTIVHYEADMYFTDDDGSYHFDVTELYAAHKWCQEQTRKALENGNHVIVSNTFTTKRELRPYFDLANEFGIVPVVYLAQNQFENVHGVPSDKLQAMRDRFQYDISSLFNNSNETGYEY